MTSGRESPDGAQRHRGVRGGEIVAEGTPETVAATSESFTGQYLRPLLERASVKPAVVESAPAKPRKRRMAEEIAAE